MNLLLILLTPIVALVLEILLARAAIQHLGFSVVLTAWGVAALVGFILIGRRLAPSGPLRSSSMFEPVFRLLGALLLILPGFLSDLLALILILPPSRRLLLKLLATRFRFFVSTPPTRTSRTWSPIRDVEVDVRTETPTALPEDVP